MPVPGAMSSAITSRGFITGGDNYGTAGYLNSDGYRYHSFTTNGTSFTVNSNFAPFDVEFILIGGGGSGGASSVSGGSGGGGAGAVYQFTVPLLTAGTYTLGLGAGGTAPSAGTNGSSGSPTYVTIKGIRYQAGGGAGGGTYNSSGNAATDPAVTGLVASLTAGASTLTLTTGTTTNMRVGDLITKTAGTGTFAANTYVSTIISSTQFVISNPVASGAASSTTFSSAPTGRIGNGGGAGGGPYPTQGGTGFYNGAGHSTTSSTGLGGGGSSASGVQDSSTGGTGTDLSAWRYGNGVPPSNPSARGGDGSNGTVTNTNMGSGAKGASGTAGAQGAILIRYREF